ncbi:hypothetical protein KAU09_03650 [Candidatus Parcubacteria bacterium]|nr:hypothetical protein [Candidatus Parcubacteria bacterium]
MLIIYHCEINKDYKNLKRFPEPKKSLEAWGRLFCLKGLSETPGIEQYPGFGGRKIYKARVVPLKENCGKSKGYRLIFQLLGNGDFVFLVFSRHGIYNSEKDLMNLIKNRIC